MDSILDSSLDSTLCPSLPSSLDTTTELPSVKKPLPKTAAERKRIQRNRAREKMTDIEQEQFRLNEKMRVREVRQKVRNNLSDSELAKKRSEEVERVTVWKQKKRLTLPRTRVQLFKAMNTVYSRNQSLGKATRRCHESLPYSPRKKIAVVANVAVSMGLHVDSGYTQLKSGPTAMDEDLKSSVRKFFFQPDICYTMPGKFLFG